MSLSVLVLHVALEQTLLVRILSGLLHRAELLLSVQDDLHRVGSRWAVQVACKWVVVVRVACIREVAVLRLVQSVHYQVSQEEELALPVSQEEAHLAFAVSREQAQEQVIRISILA